jgi:hypothetical protein
MRPGTGPAEVLILDTLPECKVVNDAFSDRSIPQPSGRPDWSLQSRFDKQTKETLKCGVNADEGVPILVETWDAAPEFVVEPQDVGFVLAAARKVLREDNREWRIYNRLTRRTSAAKRIVNYLVSAQ